MITGSEGGSSVTHKEKQDDEVKITMQMRPLGSEQKNQCF